LRALGHDVITISETGKAEQAWSDEDLLEFSTQDNRALLTLNRKHFIRLHRVIADHAGIVSCTFDPNFVGQAGRIDEVVGSTSSLRGQLLRVNRPSST
jgi:hypothetical protein